MGASHSLDCMSKKSKERKKQLEKNGKSLADTVTSHRDNVDGLQRKGTRLVSRVSTRDRALVEGRIGSSEKKFGDLVDQVEKTKRQYDIIDHNLDDIREEVDQYLAWLKEKEDLLTRETPRGYSVKEAEAKLAKNNDLRKELEEKRANLENVKQKSDSLIQDLSRVERNMVERWIAKLTTESQKVMDIVDSQNNALAEQAGEKALFQESLDKVNLWLQDKELEVQKLQGVRLASGDVEKQVDKCKTLQSEVNAYQPHLENLRKMVEPLLLDCSPELAAELKHMISEVEDRNEGLLSALKQEQGQLKDHAAARKLFETDVQKVDRWCKETEISCSTEPNLECAIQVLAEQNKHYKNLQNTSQLFASLVKEVEDRGAIFLPEIYEADKVKLEGTLKSTREKYNRVAALIKERADNTETALHSRSQVHDSVTEATDWLNNIQDQIKQLQGTPVGPTTEDANSLLEKYEDISEKIANFQPSIAQLNQAVERLRSNGQNVEADEILQLTSQYEMAMDKVDQESTKCKQAVAFRQNYATQKAQLEAAVQECEDEINEVAQSGMPIGERIERFKAITEKLQSTEPLFMVVSDKAQQLECRVR
ncbi:nesprin-1 [Mytilus galloprovincialis]|uniref:Nesprin-1 n=1 Tax=Mytilus galloprovincialis TaxID=29158 RepID=A0A8B6EYS1_MYTGA|nr:nesprin-1 [Mytilus galloprovincialis]